jgi:hypothetical protein
VTRPVELHVLRTSALHLGAILSAAWIRTAIATPEGGRGLARRGLHLPVPPDLAQHSTGHCTATELAHAQPILPGLVHSGSSSHHYPQQQASLAGPMHSETARLSSAQCRRAGGACMQGAGWCSPAAAAATTPDNRHLWLATCTPKSSAWQRRVQMRGRGLHACMRAHLLDAPLAEDVRAELVDDGPCTLTHSSKVRDVEDIRVEYVWRVAREVVPDHAVCMNCAPFSTCPQSTAPVGWRGGPASMLGWVFSCTEIRGKAFCSAKEKGMCQRAASVWHLLECRTTCTRQVWNAAAAASHWLPA